MIQRTYADIVTPELLKGAIENREFAGFLEDYHVLHCLIRKYKPMTFFEIGTNMGTGTRIIKNAMGDGEVYSLDLPFERVHHSMKRGGKDLVGHHCDLPFTQLRGDSMTFNFSQYPCDGYFVDGEHEYKNVLWETAQILNADPKIIIYHDLHVIPVKEAINDIFHEVRDYDLYRVTDTRIGYAVRKNKYDLHSSKNKR